MTRDESSRPDTHETTMRSRDRGATPAVRFARWGGVVLTSLGILGVAVTGFEDPLRRTGDPLFVLELNPLLTLVHLAAGLALLVASAASEDAARTVTLLAAAAFGVAGLLGFALVGTPANVLGVNHAGNLLHLLTAALATGCALRTPRTSPAAAPGRRDHRAHGPHPT